jgi:hypothetical protein
MRFEAVRQGRSTVINGHASAESVPEADPASPRPGTCSNWYEGGLGTSGGVEGGEMEQRQMQNSAASLTLQGLVVTTICTTSSNIQKFYILPTRRIYVFLCISQTKQRLFFYTVSNDGFLYTI